MDDGTRDDDWDIDDDTNPWRVRVIGDDLFSQYLAALDEYECRLDDQSQKTAELIPASAEI